MKRGSLVVYQGDIPNSVARLTEGDTYIVIAAGESFHGVLYLKICDDDNNVRDLLSEHFHLLPSPTAPAPEEWRLVMKHLLTSYLATFDGNKDELAMKAEAMIYAAPPPPACAPEGWRTMESAPHEDGRSVALWAEGSDVNLWTWHADDQRWYCADLWWKEDGEFGPTHWFPLPPHPLNPGGETK